MADLVRAANSYYSNLIEGHAAHPDDRSQDPHQRDLQQEAEAHAEVQRWIDGGGLSGGRAYRMDGIREIHRRLYERLPEDFRLAENPATGRRFRVVPGEFRQYDVRVWGQVAAGPGAVQGLLQRFEEAFGRAGKVETVLSLAVAHHRLLWIHPFPDGNARVARLMSHAGMLDTLDTGALWSLSRGLAANVHSYRSLLANCATQGEAALAEFTRFFLTVCLDEVRFIQGLVRPDRLRARILLWADEEVKLGKLPGKSGSLLDALLYRGEISRGETDVIFGTGERQARRIVSALLERGVLTSERPTGPVRLAFPAALAAQWLPGLFPDYRG